MTAKEFLNRAKTLDRRINVKLDRVTRLRAMTQKITASYDGEQVSHTRNVTSLQDTIIRLMEEEESLNESIDRLVDLKREVSDVLKQINDTDCQLLLELRYLCYRSWEEIAEVMHMHIRTVYRVHGRALLKVDAVLKSADFKEKSESVSWCQ